MINALDFLSTPARSRSSSPEAVLLTMTLLTMQVNTQKIAHLWYQMIYDFFAQRNLMNLKSLMLQLFLGIQKTLRMFVRQCRFKVKDEYTSLYW